MNWRTYTCDFCPGIVACRTATSKVVVATPCRQGGLLVIGEAPGEDEDAHGIGFVGAAGIVLRKLLHDANLFSPEYGVANICRCRPRDDQGNNRAPTQIEISQCLPYLGSLIRDARPKVILAVGVKTAAKVLCGGASMEEQLRVGEETGWRAEPIRHLAHEAIRDALKDVSYIVPMPHTSPKNRTPGHKDIAKTQVALAAKLLYQREISGQPL
jgi:uracil-DNA glycosylase family 4